MIYCTHIINTYVLVRRTNTSRPACECYCWLAEKAKTFVELTLRRRLSLWLFYYFKTTVVLYLISDLLTFFFFSVYWITEPCLSVRESTPNNPGVYDDLYKMARLFFFFSALFISFCFLFTFRLYSVFFSLFFFFLKKLLLLLRSQTSHPALTRVELECCRPASTTVA